MTYKEFIEYCDSDRDFVIKIEQNPRTSMYDHIFIRYRGNEHGLTYPISTFNEFSKIRLFCEERKKELIDLYKRTNTKIGHLMLVKAND